MIGQPKLGELIDAGSTIVIECVTLEWNPTPQVTWTKDGSILDTESESETIQNFEITVSNNGSQTKSILTIQVCLFFTNLSLLYLKVYICKIKLCLL